MLLSGDINIANNISDDRRDKSTHPAKAAMLPLLLIDSVDA